MLELVEGGDHMKKIGLDHRLSCLLLAEHLQEADNTWAQEENGGRKFIIMAQRSIREKDTLSCII